MSDRLLVAVDMDGTLLDTEAEDHLRDREVAALEAVRAAGHVVAICTGRNGRSLDSLLDHTGWHPRDLPKVTLNGAVVTGGEPYRRLAYNILGGDELRRVVRAFQDHGVMPMVYGVDEDGGVLFTDRGDVNPILATYLEHRQEWVGALTWTDDLLAEMPATALEVGSIDTIDAILPLTRSLREAMPDAVRVINTRSLLGRNKYYWAEVYHHACSKGTGVLELATAYGIPRSRIVAIGDNYNDLDMFAAAAVAVAMGGGPDDVVAAAHHVADPVAVSGAAAILEAIATGAFPPAAVVDEEMS